MSGEPQRVCTCTEFRDAVQEELVAVMEFRKKQAQRTVYLLPHPGGDLEEGRLMVFCPFCAGTVGDGWQVAADTHTQN